MRPFVHALRRFVVVVLLSALCAPTALAQGADANALLVEGATIRFAPNAGATQSVQAVILARRGDSLDLRIGSSWGAEAGRVQRTVDWRTLHRLEARDHARQDSKVEGAMLGALVGAMIGALADGSGSGGADLTSANDPGIGIIVLGILGFLIGLGMDAGTDSSPWVAVSPP